MFVSLIAAAATLAVPQARRLECPDQPILHNASGTADARARRLGDLPPANHVLTVYREVERCPVPVIVRYGIGGDR